MAPFSARLPPEPRIFLNLVISSRLQGRELKSKAKLGSNCRVISFKAPTAGASNTGLGFNANPKP